MAAWRPYNLAPPKPEVFQSANIVDASTLEGQVQALNDYRRELLDYYGRLVRYHDDLAVWHQQLYTNETQFNAGEPEEAWTGVSFTAEELKAEFGTENGDETQQKDFEGDVDDLDFDVKDIMESAGFVLNPEIARMFRRTEIKRRQRKEAEAAEELAEERDAAVERQNARSSGHGRVAVTTENDTNDGDDVDGEDRDRFYFRQAEKRRELKEALGDTKDIEEIFKLEKSLEQGFEAFYDRHDPPFWPVLPLK